MAGNFKGAIMRKLGLKGKQKPGDMIARMNAMKGGFKPKTPKMTAGSASGVGRLQKAAMAKKTKKKTSTATKTATKTSTVANPKGNITITGGAGRGANTTVKIAGHKKKTKKKVMLQGNRLVSAGGGKNTYTNNPNYGYGKQAFQGSKSLSSRTSMSTASRMKKGKKK